MSKYRPLGDYLRQQAVREMTLSFHDIERIIGAELPASSYMSQWWTTSSAAHGRRRRAAWYAAGYAASLVLGDDKVTFRRVA